MFAQLNAQSRSGPKRTITRLTLQWAAQQRTQQSTCVLIMYCIVNYVAFRRTVRWRSSRNKLVSHTFVKAIAILVAHFLFFYKIWGESAGWASGESFLAGGESGWVSSGESGWDSDGSSSGVHSFEQSWSCKITKKNVELYFVQGVHRKLCYFPLKLRLTWHLAPVRWWNTKH